MNNNIQVFLSYGRDGHADLAARLRDDLVAAGHATWFDRDRLPHGGDWEAWIEDGLDWVAAAGPSGRFVLLMTPHAVRRPDGFCLNELARALARQVPVLPVMAVACEPPLSICRLQWFDLTDCVPLADREEQYRARLPYLLRAVEQGHAAPLLTPSGRDLDPLTGLLALAAPTDRFVGIPEAPGATVPRRLPAAFPVGTPIRLMVHADAGCHFLLLNVSASGGVGCVCPSWLAPDPRLHPGANPFPQPSSAYRAFPLDEPGREVLLGVLSDRPLPLDLMPPDQQTPAAVLGPRQIDRLAAELRAMDRHEWEAVVTYIDVEPGPGAG